MSESETFGQMLKRLRDAKGWTLREAADRMGISFPYLSQLEAGVAKRPSEDLAKKIAEVFGENQERVMFLARNIPAELEEIMRKYPTTSQPYFKPSHFKGSGFPILPHPGVRRQDNERPDDQNPVQS